MELHLFKELLELFAETEIFIFIFMEIIIKVPIVQKIMLRQFSLWNCLGFILIFGCFSIFGTYIGIPLQDGAISNVRDFAPMMAGLLGGPWIGLGAGLIGGVHRMFLGGISAISCGLATILAGLIAGGFYVLIKNHHIRLWQGLLIAILIEGVHGGLTLLIARPFENALGIITNAIPAMAVANGLGILIGLILSDHVRRTHEAIKV